MEYKIIAEIKGASYNSIKFAVDSKDLTRVVEVLNQLKTVDDNFLLVEDGYKSVYFECEPIRIKVETNVPIYNAEEVNAMRLISEELEKKRAEAKAEEEAA